ncbi:MAG: ACT domain-containing protein [Candidatus Hinthialibacter antarcticus]|nr:ACT domain-containing protein [Candidatus Hinthialibacter antarcticus]
MRKSLVLSLTGHDRIGIVEEVTKEILPFGGNVESSRMARLGGEFAMLMLISAPEEQVETLIQRIQALQDNGYIVTICTTEPGDPNKFQEWSTLQIEVFGADHEGIIHTITQRLAELKISVETMDTGMSEAPLSGSPLFMMSATVMAPPELSLSNLQDDLEKISDALNVDIDVSLWLDDDAEFEGE